VVCHHPQVQRRKENPSRQRRRARREKERSTEKDRASEIDAEKPDRKFDKAREAENAVNLQDEFCSDTIYVDKGTENGNLVEVISYECV
jgi:hypothetical protein